MSLATAVARPPVISRQVIYCTRCSGGSFQVPFKASAFGQYRRIATENGPVGAGSQLGTEGLAG